MKYYLLTPCILFQLFSFILFSQVTTEWVRTYNGSLNANDFGVMCSVDDSGNVYVAGGSSELVTGTDIVLIKYNSVGSELWRRLYKPSGSNSEHAGYMVTDKNGHIYITGSYYSSPDNSYVLTLKYNSAGTLIWEKTFNTSSNEAGGNCINLDKFHNVLITGNSYDSMTNSNILILKYNEYGTLLWARSFNGPIDGNDVSFNSVLDSSGNIYITGYSEYSSLFFDAITIKYSAFGNLMWVNTVNGTQDYYDMSKVIRIDKHDNIYIGGYIINDPHFFHDFLIVKYNSNGTGLWKSFYNSSGNNSDVVHDLAIDEEGNVYATGSCIIGITKSVTVKYDSSGSFQWDKILDSFGSLPISISYNNNKLFITGDALLAGPYFDIFTISYNTDGSQNWIEIFNGSQNRDDISKYITTDNNYNLYITGTTYSNSFDDLLLIKYSYLTGIIQNEISLQNNFLLYQNYPNPFNTTTKITYDLPEKGNVNIKIFNILGQELTTLVNEFKPAGSYKVLFDGSNYSSGTYLYRLSVNNYNDIKRMVLVK